MTSDHREADDSGVSLSDVTGHRTPPATLRSLRPVNWGIARLAGAVTRTGDMHLFSTLGQTGGLFRAWLFYSGRLMPFGGLPRKDTETVILRVAALRDCRYEQDHHLRLGARAGIDDALADAIAAGPDAPGLDSRTALILRAVDELVSTRDLSDATWTELTTVWSSRSLIEFVLLVTQYDGLATTITTLRIPRDYQ